MDSSKKKTPDYTDIAYREAVARLRYLLAESYSPQATPTKIPHVHMMKPDDSGDETDASGVLSERSRQVSYRVPYFSSKRTLYSDSLPRLTHGGSTLNVPAAPEMGDGVKSDSQQPPPELMAFIERQEEYIEQLEKESQYCREELSNLLGKVKEVISENEGLHEKEKSGLLKSVFDCFESEEDDQDGEHDKTDKRKLQPTKKKRLEGPSIVFESRISELEAQLTQTRIDLRKALEEAETCKKKLADGHPSSDSSLGHVDSYRQQIETLQREKDELSEKLSKMNSAVNQIRDKESDSSQKVKRSLDLVDQAQFEKAQAELEVRRLKDELDRQHDKLRDLLQEQGRRVQEERVQAERRYAQQIEQLSADLTTQWDSASKLQLELEKQRRTESELRRELQQKNITIEELKKELQTKIAGLQSEATQSAAERGSLEQELAASRLMAERAERELRQESSRLQAEVTALRQRLDRADSDLLHSRRENLRLSEQVASLEREERKRQPEGGCSSNTRFSSPEQQEVSSQTEHKLNAADGNIVTEVNLAKMMKESSDKGLSDSAPSTSSPVKQTREKELTSMIMDMEAKHVSTVAELESMIQSQNQLMEKLKDECRTLTQKLEDSSARHKEEKSTLREENAVLLGKLEKIWTNYKELEKECIEFGVYSREQSGGIMEVQENIIKFSLCISLAQYYKVLCQKNLEIENLVLQSYDNKISSQGGVTQWCEHIDDTYVEERDPGTEHGFQAQYESQPQFEPQQEYESQLQYEPQSEYEPQPQSRYKPQSDYQPQSRYEPQSDYQPQSGYQPKSDYDSQPQFNSQQEYEPQSEFLPQQGYEPQSQFQSEGYEPQSEFQSQGYEPKSEFQSQGYEPQSELQPQQDYEPQSEYQPLSHQYESEQDYETQPGYLSKAEYLPQSNFQSQPEYDPQSDFRPQTGFRPPSRMEPQANSGDFQLQSSNEPLTGFRRQPSGEFHQNLRPKSDREPEPGFRDQSSIESQPSSDSYPSIRSQPSLESQPGLRTQPSTESQSSFRPQPGPESKTRPQPNSESQSLYKLQPSSDSPSAIRSQPSIESQLGIRPQSQSRQESGAPFTGPPPPQSSEA